MPAPTRTRVYLLASEGVAPSAIARSIGRSLPTVQYHLRHLVEEGYVRRMGKGTPAFYKATRKPFEEDTIGDGSGPSKTRVHHVFRKFKVTHPPVRPWPFRWTRHWEASGVRFSVIEGLVLDTMEGKQIVGLRYSKGPKNISISVHVEEDRVISLAQVKAHGGEATDKALLVVKALTRWTGLRVGLPEEPSSAHYAIQGVWFDTSNGEGELETSNKDLAALLTDPRAFILQVIQDNQKEER